MLRLPKLVAILAVVLIGLAAPQAKNGQETTKSFYSGSRTTPDHNALDLMHRVHTSELL